MDVNVKLGFTLQSAGVLDRRLEIHEPGRRGITRIDLPELKIADCKGCFGCRTKTPGKCVLYGMTWRRGSWGCTVEKTDILSGP